MCICQLGIRQFFRSIVEFWQRDYQYQQKDLSAFKNSKPFLQSVQMDHVFQEVHADPWNKSKTILTRTGKFKERKAFQ